MPNLLNLVTKSVTNFWSGNSCPLIDDIKQEVIRNVDMKIIFTTEFGNPSRSWKIFEMVFKGNTVVVDAYREYWKTLLSTGNS